MDPREVMVRRRRRSRIGWALTAAAVSLLVPAAVRIGSAPPTFAADRFVDTVGVNIHLHYDHTLYKEDFPLVKKRLLELGVRHTRDGLVDTQWQGYYDRHNELGDAGITGTFITSFDQSVTLLADYPSRMSRAFAAYEAPNEADRSGDPRWPDRLRVMMTRLGDLNRISSVTQFPVLAPSLTIEESYARLGDVSASFDIANMHNYLAGRHPGTGGWGADGYGSIAWNLQLVRRYARDKPIMTTETGYQDQPGVEDWVPQAVAARYLPRLLLEHFQAGIARTFIYELADFDNSGHYGLLNADGSPKPAFHAVRNLLALLADPGALFEVTPLDYALENEGGGLRHVAFQKRDRSYLIALWIEEAAYDVPARLQTTVAPRSAILNLPVGMQAVRVHRWREDGLVDTSSVDVPGNRLEVTVTDRLALLEITFAAPR